MKVLLSIKPEFAYKIFTGEKKYEFRRIIFKKDVKKVIVYASSPVKMVIGEFEVEKILSDEISALWKRTHKYSGISEDFFYSYFADKAIGHAIKVKTSMQYEQPLCIKKYFSAVPPQSFIYID